MGNKDKLDLAIERGLVLERQIGKSVFCAVQITKSGQVYIVFYTSGRENEAVITLGRWCADSGLPEADAERTAALIMEEANQYKQKKEKRGKRG